MITTRREYKNILFDLDGTLVDSSQGIINSLIYAFEKMATNLPDKSTLSSFIGPPLETSFKPYFSTQTEIDTAIYFFREFYRETGVYQTHLYPEIKEVLQVLKSQDFRLFVTTSKFEPMAIKMLSELNVNFLFDGIYGATSDRFHKSEIVQYCLDLNNILLNDTIIVGDTKYDIIGAKTVGIGSAGVTWGFGSFEDLQKNGADLIISSPKELLQL